MFYLESELRIDFGMRRDNSEKEEGKSDHGEPLLVLENRSCENIGCLLCISLVIDFSITLRIKQSQSGCEWSGGYWSEENPRGMR